MKYEDYKKMKLLECIDYVSNHIQDGDISNTFLGKDVAVHELILHLGRISVCLEDSLESDRHE